LLKSVADESRKVCKFMQEIGCFDI
jgi:hypothetical protein